jgi:hypothetical protein
MSHIYVLRSESSYEEVYKVGITSSTIRELESRYMTSIPHVSIYLYYTTNNLVDISAVTTKDYKVGRVYLREYGTFQTEKYSSDNQLKVINEYVKDNNILVKRIYKDIASGKKIDNRPELDQMLTDLKPEEYVIVFSLDRLTRSSNDGFKIIDIIKDKKVGLIISENNMIIKPNSFNYMYDAHINMIIAYCELETSRNNDFD